MDVEIFPDVAGTTDVVKLDDQTFVADRPIRAVKRFDLSLLGLDLVSPWLQPSAGCTLDVR